ncbi:hypothetical protein N0V85_000661 [Neurospora sp. IMI 360204]|nr:hypothetical protein N0V85_000661 [Neurospora sp. IMI 360204]
MTTTEAAAIVESVIRNFIHGCHILHYHLVLDAYGHISFRHPLRPHIFVMAKNMPPAAVSSQDDLIQYWVENAEPVEEGAPKGYVERLIHSEIYKRHNEVNAVVHAHADAVIPFTLISGIPLRSCYHMAGFLGTDGPPVWDIADHYLRSDIPDMLVRHEHLGRSLAKSFDGGNVVTLMRGHGFTAISSSIEDAVFRAIYTMKNAAIQSATLSLSAPSAATNNFSPSPAIRYLNRSEAWNAAETLSGTISRPWELWVREVGGSGLYSSIA